MTKLCILHAGQPKTGSSSLQNYLAANDEALRAHGILYPRTDRANGVTQHGALMRALAGRSRLRASEHLPELLSQELVATPHDVLLISAEYLSTPLYFQQEPAVWRFFRKRGYRIEVLTYLRDQPDFLNSAYVQIVKNARFAGNFDAFLDMRLRKDAGGAGHNTDHSVITGSRLGWGGHSFLAYDADVRRGGIEQHFMTALRALLDRAGPAPGHSAGLDAEAVRALPVPARVNEAEGPLVVAAGRRLAAELLLRFRGKVLYNLTLRTHRILHDCLGELGVTEQRYTAMTPYRYDRLRGHYRATNARFAGQFWDRAWDTAFPPADPAALASNDVDETGNPEQHERLAALLAIARPRVLADVAAAETRLERRGLAVESASRAREDATPETGSGAR
jgi:hypothetical protein